MKILYFDCGMGAAGDMLTAALTELTNDKNLTVEKLNSMKIPDVVFSCEEETKCGIKGSHMTVKVYGEEEHEHINDHEHHHQSSMENIYHIISHLDVSDKVKQDIINVYNLIAEAESHVHGVPVTEIHFHEVGTMDAIADIAAVCLLIEEINPDKIFASPIHVGSGSVQCVHGILPVPAPATAYLLRDIPMYSGNTVGELCTPTGAALLKYFVSEFGQMPVIKTEKIGYGMGKKDFEKANCIRAFLGETQDSTDEITKLECNLDDMTGEQIAFACEILMSSDVLDVYTVPINMKKNRPGTMLCVLCKSENTEQTVKLIMKHTSTLGIRESICKRYTLARENTEIQSSFGTIHKKISSGYGVKKSKYEFDELAEIAKNNNISINDVLKEIEK